MMVVDSIAERFNAAWTKKGAWQAEIATASTTIRMKMPKQKGNPAARAVRAALSPIAPNNNSHSNSNNNSAENTAGEASIATEAVATAPAIRKQPEMMTMELKLTLLKPLQLMNVSGTSVSRAGKEKKKELPNSNNSTSMSQKGK